MVSPITQLTRAPGRSPAGWCAPCGASVETSWPSQAHSSARLQSSRPIPYSPAALSLRVWVRSAQPVGGPWIRCRTTRSHANVKASLRGLGPGRPPGARRAWVGQCGVSSSAKRPACVYRATVSTENVQVIAAPLPVFGSGQPVSASRRQRRLGRSGDLRVCGAVWPCVRPCGGVSGGCGERRPSAAERVAERRAHSAHHVLADAPDGTREGCLGDGVKPIAVDH